MVKIIESVLVFIFFIGKDFWIVTGSENGISDCLGEVMDFLNITHNDARSIARCLRSVLKFVDAVESGPGCESHLRKINNELSVVVVCNLNGEIDDGIYDFEGSKGKNRRSRLDHVPGRPAGMVVDTTEERTDGFSGTTGALASKDYCCNTERKQRHRRCHFAGFQNI